MSLENYYPLNQTEVCYWKFKSTNTFQKPSCFDFGNHLEDAANDGNALNRIREAPQGDNGCGTVVTDLDRGINGDGGVIRGIQALKLFKCENSFTERGLNRRHNSVETLDVALANPNPAPIAGSIASLENLVSTNNSFNRIREAPQGDKECGMVTDLDRGFNGDDKGGERNECSKDRSVKKKVKYQNWRWEGIQQLWS